MPLRIQLVNFEIMTKKKQIIFSSLLGIVLLVVIFIPKREEDYIFDLTDKELAGLMVFAKKVAKAIRECVPCKRVGVAVLGLDVPHAHIHLVPLKEGNELNFANPKKQYSKEEMEACAELIRRHFKN